MKLVETKFNQCLSEYLEYCQNDKNWVEDEIYKFRFSNWVNHKVNLTTQKPEKVLQLCLESMQQRFDNHSKGIQFILFGAKREISKPISLEDVLIFQELEKNGDISILQNYNRGMSYTAMTAWLGTLLPKKFICAPTSEFALVLEYFFDCKLPKNGFQLFTESLNLFHSLKEELKKSLETNRYFYLDKINEYLLEIYANTNKKVVYDEADWNWLTEDFALFVLRIHLNYNPTKKKKVINTSKKEAGNLSLGHEEYEFDETDTAINQIESETTIDNALNEDVNNLDSLIRLNEKYKNAAPDVKKFLSKRIERGSFAQKFKVIAGSKCMICEQVNKNPYVFLKENNEYYIEVHHVIFISKRLKGTLTSANLITVCPNHHRQLHYGKNTDFIEVDDTKFLFKLDGKLISIKKLPFLKEQVLK